MIYAVLIDAQVDSLVEYGLSITGNGEPLHMVLRTLLMKVRKSKKSFKGMPSRKVSTGNFYILIYPGVIIS